VRARCRHAWAFWLIGNGALFGYLEWRGYRVGCHPTLSRELRRWTGCKRHPWTALVFAALGAWLTYHELTLKDAV
jgi:hypothetical protein